MPEADLLRDELVDAFDEELAPQPDDAAKLDAMVVAALDAEPPEPTDGGPDPAGGSGSMMTIGFSAVVAAIAIVAVIMLPTDTPAPRRSSPTAHAQAPRVPAARPTTPAPTPALAQPVPTPEPVETKEPASEQASQPASEPPTEPRAKAPPPSAAELLRRANEARRANDYAKANRLFDRLAREHAGSREEVLARVTHGELLLDRLHQPKAALEKFDAYLDDKPSGTLAEEALVGRAQALAKLGRAQAEARAWQRLIERFPGSAHAPAARRRIDALGR